MKDNLIVEEQNNLDSIIDQLDTALVSLNTHKQNLAMKRDKLRTSCLADTYGDLIVTQKNFNEVDKKITDTKLTKKQLYSNHIVVESIDGNKTRKWYSLIWLQRKNSNHILV